MGLDELCADFQIMGVESFLHSLRIFAQDGDHPQQAIIERLIELCEKCTVDYPLLPDYVDLVNSVYATYDFLRHSRYSDEMTGKMSTQGELAILDDGRVVWLKT
jgi:hypothetical protein